MVPLFPGVPGGPELLVILLLLIALFGVPVVLAVLGWRYLGRDDQLDELEARVRDLESELGRGHGADGETEDEHEDETEGPESRDSAG